MIHVKIQKTTCVIGLRGKKYEQIRKLTDFEVSKPNKNIPMLKISLFNLFSKFKEPHCLNHIFINKTNGNCAV